MPSDAQLDPCIMHFFLHFLVYTMHTCSSVYGMVCMDVSVRFTAGACEADVPQGGSRNTWRSLGHHPDSCELHAYVSVGGTRCSAHQDN